MTMLQPEPRRRVADHSNAEAREAVGRTLQLFAAWHGDLARFATLVERRSGHDRATILARCDAIEAEVMAARTELIADLAEAPQKVRGHSRVVDVEKALDGVMAKLAHLRGRLGA